MKVYEEPFDEKADNIALDGVDNGDYCSVFMNGVYHGFKDNMDGGYQMSLDKMYDNIKDRVEKAIPTKDNNEKIGLEIDTSTNLSRRDERLLIFGCNENVDTKRKREEDRDDNKSALRKRLNIEYK